MKKIQIETPSNEEAGKYIKIWDAQDNWVLQERSLDKLFFKVCPKRSYGLYEMVQDISSKEGGYVR